MKKAEEQVLVYLVQGFLESGKTSFLNYTMNQEYFQINEPTLVIACEEGDVEYEAEEFQDNHTFLEMIEEAEDFSYGKLKALQDRYKPSRVLIECNAFWDVKVLREMKMPAEWEVIQRIVTVDGSTFDVYMSNMKSVFMEMIRDADMVIFNRCCAEQSLANYRRSIKVVNPAAEIIFENRQGQLINIFDSGVPYDLEAGVIDISDEDYGIFYIDMRDNPKRYSGKKVRFKGRVLKSRNPSASFFMPARMAMTCCADDTSYIGYACKSPEAKDLPMGQWITVTADVRWEWFSAYKEKGPVLYAKTIEKAEAPQTELVYFNL